MDKSIYTKVRLYSLVKGSTDVFEFCEEPLRYFEQKYSDQDQPKRARPMRRQAAAGHRVQYATISLFMSWKVKLHSTGRAGGGPDNNLSPDKKRAPPTETQAKKHFSTTQGLRKSQHATPDTGNSTTPSTPGTARHPAPGTALTPGTRTRSTPSTPTQPGTALHKHPEHSTTPSTTPRTHNYTRHLSVPVPVRLGGWCSDGAALFRCSGYLVYGCLVVLFRVLGVALLQVPGAVLFRPLAQKQRYQAPVHQVPGTGTALHQAAGTARHQAPGTALQQAPSQAPGTALH